MVKFNCGEVTVVKLHFFFANVTFNESKCAKFGISSD